MGAVAATGDTISRSGPSPSGRLDEDELATRAGTTVDKIRDLARLGIIRRRGDDGFYAESDIVRARLAISLDGSGISLEDLGKGIEGGHVSMDFADRSEEHTSELQSPYVI